MYSVRIDTVPANGTLTLYDQNVYAGMEISIWALDQLYFVPYPEWYGTTLFTWSAWDGTDYSTSSASAEINITRLDLNDPPSVTSFSVEGKQDNLLAIHAWNFASSYFDADGDQMYMVRIDTLPAKGVLSLYNENVYAGMEILFTDLDQLSFAPNSGWYGTTLFTWSASDGTDYSTSPASAKIKIIGTNKKNFLYLPVIIRNGH